VDSISDRSPVRGVAVREVISTSDRSPPGGRRTGSLAACLAIAVASASLAWSGHARAAPGPDARAKYAQAVRLSAGGDPEQALAAIDEGLALAPKDLPLLKLKSTLLLQRRNYLGALDALLAYLAAGASGANRREATKLAATLEPVKRTALEIALANAPATIYVNGRERGVFCTANPACTHPMPPGSYKVLAERPGYDPWSGRVTVVKNTTTKLAITLVETASPVAVRAAPDGARVQIDGADYAPGSKLAAGTHQLLVSLAGYAELRRELTAHEGNPVDIDVALTPLVPVRLSPPGARLTIDGKPAGVASGALELLPGGHVAVANAPGYITRRVDIPADRPAGYALAMELTAVELPRPRSSWFTIRRAIAIAAGGAGLAASATGVVLGMRSRQLDRDAYALCPSPLTPCDRAVTASELNLRARSRAHQANIAFGAAGGLAVAAAVLWFTGAPESRFAVAPHVGPAAGLDVAGRF